MKTIGPGESIPFGLSKWKDIISGGWQFRLPIFSYHGLHYDIARDAYRPGWAAFNLLLKYRMQELTLRWGWAFIKQTGEEQCRS